MRPTLVIRVIWDSEQFNLQTINMRVFCSGGSIEQSSVTVTPIPGDSSALNGAIIAAITIPIVVVTSLLLLLVVVGMVAVLRRKSKAKTFAR